MDPDGNLLIDYLTKGHTINADYYSSLLVMAIEGHFEGITPTPREGNQGGLVLAQSPGSPGTCNPEETGLPVLPVFSSSSPFSGSDPVGLPSVLWTEKKKQLKGRHFSSEAEVIAAAETRLDGQHFDFFFFELPSKVRATG